MHIVTWYENTTTGEWIPEFMEVFLEGVINHSFTPVQVHITSCPGPDTPVVLIWVPWYQDRTGVKLCHQRIHRWKNRGSPLQPRAVVSAIHALPAEPKPVLQQLHCDCSNVYAAGAPYL